MTLNVSRQRILAAGAFLLAPLVAGGWERENDLPRRFQAHINYLASDELEGRGVGSCGIESAARYIAEQFAQAGLSPGGDDGTYFQTFSMTLQRSLTEEGRLAFSGDTVARRQSVDFIPYSFSSEHSFSGEVVFVGYGIAVPEKSYDDFAGTNLHGAVAMMLTGEPPSWADADGVPTRHAMLRNKIYNAKDRGAAAVLLVNPSPAEGETDRLPPFSAEDPDEYGLPALHLTRAWADERLAAAKAGTLAERQARLDAGRPASTVLAHQQASGQAGFVKHPTTTKNVIGLRPGRGALRDECVVIGAHYDHLGRRRPMAKTFKAGKLVREESEPVIHNGADDNASGVSGLMEIARLFGSDAGSEPCRQLLFIAFSGEEAGLHGSKYYVDHPKASLAQTAAMLNMDMIGRLPLDGDKVEVFGLATASEFDRVVRQAASRVGLSVAPGVDAGGRSDHAPFLRSGIPSLHFMTGVHPDYHRPTDDADKINAAGGAKVTRLVHDVARALSLQETKPVFDRVAALKVEKEERGPAPSFRVRMGLSPSYTDDGQPGMGVDAVSPEGPADLAGMKAKDRILRINDKPIANIHDYMASTRNNQPGDVVEVVVLRDGKELVLKVTLAAAR